MRSARVLPRDGSTLHYWLSGPSAGPIVALTHGACLDHHSFDHQVAALEGAGFQVLTWDMPGHGASKRLVGRFTVARLAEDLRALLDEVGATEAIVLGHSMGGYVAQEFAHRFRERTSALVVVGSTDLARPASRLWRPIYAALPLALRCMSLNGYRKRALADLALRAPVRDYAKHAMSVIDRKEFIDIIRGGVHCLWFGTGHGDDHSIPMPFLLTHGDRDRANRGVFIKSSPRWAARVPSCVYEVVPNAGHAAHMDNPEAFNALLLRFLSRHDRAV